MTTNNSEQKDEIQDIEPAPKPPCYLAFGRFLTDKEYHSIDGCEGKELLAGTDKFGQPCKVVKSLKNLINKHIFGIVISLLFFTGANAEYTDMIFIEHSNMPMTNKYNTKANSPILWKDNIVRNGGGYEIFDELNFTKYYLMTHAYLNNEQVIVYRVCEKENIKHDYKYGSVLTNEMRGYTVSYSSLIKLDSYLYREKFITYATKREDILRYNAKTKKEYNQNYKNTFPKSYFIKVKFPRIIICSIVGYLMFYNISFVIQIYLSSNSIYIFIMFI